MDDRELLEMAALAAGIELKYDTFGNGPNADREYNYWNPLIDNADALRLAAKLDLAIHHGFSVGSKGAFHCVNVWHPNQTSNDGVKEYCDPNEKLSATRRAIVRAAAEIGRRKND